MKHMLTIEDRNGAVMFKQASDNRKSDLISFAKSHALVSKFYISCFNRNAGGWIETYNGRGELTATTKGI